MFNAIFSEKELKVNYRSKRREYRKTSNENSAFELFLSYNSFQHKWK